MRSSGVVGHYEFLEDMAIADCAIDLVAESLDDLFATAARALAAVMIDPDAVVPSLERRIALEAEARDLLLFDWLGELILRKDRDGEVFPTAEVVVQGEGPCRLAAVVRGVRLDSHATLVRNDPKAVTLHAFLLEQVAAGWHARVVIDI